VVESFGQVAVSGGEHQTRLEPQLVSACDIGGAGVGEAVDSLSTVHGLLAGTDADNRALVATGVFTTVACAWLIVRRFRTRRADIDVAAVS